MQNNQRILQRRQSSSSSSSNFSSSPSLSQFSHLLEAYQVDEDADEKNHDIYSEERRLRRKLHFVTQRILEAPHTSNDPSEPSYGQQQQQQQQPFTVDNQSHHHDDDDIPLVIRMWLEIYDETAMQQAWRLLEHYLQHPSPSSFPIRNDESATTAAAAAAADDDDEVNDIFNLVLYNWKARWIAQEAYWQTPTEMVTRLQALVQMNRRVPLSAFHTVLQAVERGIIVEQAHEKKQGIFLQGQEPRTNSSLSFQWAVDLAENVLAFLLQQPSSSNVLTPTTVTYNSVMELWSRSNLPRAPERVEELLHHLQEQQQQQKLYPNGLRPTTGSYRAAIAAWAYNTQNKHNLHHHDVGDNGAAERAWNLLRQMIAEYQILQAATAAETFSKLNATTITEASNLRDQEVSGMPATTTAAAVAAIAESHGVDDDDDDLDDDSGSPQSTVVVKPIAKCFALVIWAFAKEGKAAQAQAVFQEQCQLFQSTGDLDFCPTVFGMNALMQAWAEESTTPVVPLSSSPPARTTPGATARTASFETNHAQAPIPGVMAEQLISQMEMLAEQTGNERLLPNIHTYRTALLAWVKSCTTPNSPQQQGNAKPIPDAPLRAEAMLRRMEFYHDNGLLDESPGITAYGMVVDAWCKAGDPERAEALLTYLQSQWQEQGLPEMKPTRIHYYMVLNAWSKSSLPDAPQRATRLLEEMKRSDDENVQPDSVAYFLLSNMWAKSKTKEGRLMVQSLLKEVKARGISGTMHDATTNTLHYNTVLNSLAQAGDAEAAEGLLRQDRRSSNGNSFEADVCSYNTVLQAWSKSRRPDAPERAQALFDNLIQRYEKTRDDRWKPTVETFTTLMTIHGNSRKSGSAERALALSEDMKRRFQAGAEHLKPDVIHYTALLNAWSKAGDAERAESFLDQMIKSAIDPNASNDDKNAIVVVIPNMRTFATVLAAWANSNDPHAGMRAERLLRRMQELSNEDALHQHPLSTLQCYPDTICYNSTLQAWRTSLLLCRTSQREEEKHQRRLSRYSNMTPKRILHRMEMLLMEMMEKSLVLGDSSVAPDHVSFLLYLTALERSSGLTDRAERAKRVLNWIQQMGLEHDDDLIQRVKKCTRRGDKNYSGNRLATSKISR